MKKIYIPLQVYFFYVVSNLVVGLTFILWGMDKLLGYSLAPEYLYPLIETSFWFFLVIDMCIILFHGVIGKQTWFNKSALIFLFGVSIGFIVFGENPYVLSITNIVLGLIFLSDIFKLRGYTVQHPIVKVEFYAK